MESEQLFHDMFRNITMSNLMFVVLTVFTFLVYFFVVKKESSGEIVTKGSIVVLVSVFLSTLSVLVYAYYLSRAIPIWAQQKSMVDLFRHLSFTENIEILIKNITLVIPALILAFNPSFRNVLGFRNIQTSVIICVVYSIIAFFLLMLFGYGLYQLSSFKNMSDFYQGIIKYKSANIYSFLVVCLVVSFSREVFFRGLIYSLLRIKMGILFSIIVSSILSAATVGIKLDLFLLVFVHACVLAFLYEKTKSIYPSVVIHFIVLTVPVLVI